MALPHTFAAVTSATGAQLDADFNAVGKLGAIPCAVSGTNTITMTPTAGITPTISALSNYLRFSGIVTTTNTGAVTITISGLTPLSAYKDSPSGPAVLSGGELIAGNAFTAVYDSTLNAGTGGFHVYTSTAFAGGTITGNLVASGATISVLGGSIGASLTSSLLTGNSFTVNALLHSGTSLQVSIASVASIQVGSTTSLATLTKMLSGLGTLTYTVTSANAVQDQNITVPGAQVRDVVALGLGASVPSGAGFVGFCGTVGVVTVRLLNPTAATIGAATMTVRAAVMGLTP